LIERAYQNQIDTIITCDNGIAAYDEIAYGKELGMTIIVTDHHEVPYEENGDEKEYILPPADAVIDPKRQDCEYPFKGL
jgi:single-stranded-DNA-specific exonuclease